MDPRVVERYSRQILCPIVHQDGQTQLCASTALVIGCGGLGSTAILYLAGSGINLKVCDGDKVEMSNLHRQIVHDMTTIGLYKTQSVKQRITALNPMVSVECINEMINIENALSIISEGVDIVLDCTDNYKTRYIINDACNIANIPLISGASVGMDGQMTVFIPSTPLSLSSTTSPSSQLQQQRDGSSACYRCLHPDPTMLSSCASCADAGVLGPVPGMIGCLQAIEAIKVIRSKQIQNTLSCEPMTGKKLLYEGSYGAFTSFDISTKRAKCEICTLKDNHRENEKEQLEALSQLFEALNRTIGNTANNINQDDLNVLNTIDAVSITVQQYKQLAFHDKIPHILLDVRSKVQYDMVNMQSMYHTTHNDLVFDENKVSIHNIPLEQLLSSPQIQTCLQGAQDEKSEMFGEMEQQGCKEMERGVYVLCRRGIASSKAVVYLKEKGLKNVYNIRGGLEAWSQQVDDDFPQY